MTRRPLDVAIVLSSLGVVRGGLETTAERLAEGLTARGHRIRLIGGRRVPCVRADLAAWRFVRRRRPGLPLKAQSLSFVAACCLHPRVRRLVTTADVTLTALEIETVLFSHWRRRHRRPNVSLFPGIIDAGWLRRDRSTVRLAVSKAVAERAGRAMRLPVDDVLLTGPPAWWLDTPYSVRREADTLLFVGRLEPNKGVWELVALFETLASRFPALKLRLVGDGPERPAIARRLREAGLAGRVHVVGAVAPADVLPELSAADLLAFPSHYESFSKTLLEAMAAGLPAVASDIPGNREVAADAACLVPLRDAETWAAAVARLLGDPAARDRLSAAGRERAKHFTAEKAVELMEYWLYQALERPVPTAPALHESARG